MKGIVRLLAFVLGLFGMVATQPSVAADETGGTLGQGAGAHDYEPVVSLSCSLESPQLRAVVSIKNTANRTVDLQSAMQVYLLDANGIILAQEWRPIDVSIPPVSSKVLWEWPVRSQGNVMSCHVEFYD